MNALFMEMGCREGMSKKKINNFFLCVLFFLFLSCCVMSPFSKNSLESLTRPARQCNKNILYNNEIYLKNREERGLKKKKFFYWFVPSQMFHRITSNFWCVHTCL